MMRATILALVLASAAASAAEVQAKSKAHVTPIQKVLEMMHDMVAKGEAEKNAEEVKFSAFSTWCGDQKRVKTEEIEDGANKIAALKAAIEKAEAEIRALTDRIQELEEDVGRWKKDQKSATDVRNKEKADFQATSADYGESLDALAGAIKVLKAQAFDRSQASAALIEVKSAKLVPVAAKKALMSFLQQPSDDTTPDEMLFREAPEAHGYEFQSGGVVDMLEKLKDQFEEQKYNLEMEETKAQHAFEDIFQQLADNIENAEHEISKKTKLRAETEAAKAEAEGEKAQTEADKAEDEKYLDETVALCTTKTADFEARQKLRADELTAINEAIDIMESDAVAGSGEKHLPQLVQKTGTALVQQLRSGQSPLQARIAEFLADRARGINSHVLALASESIKANPFKKVKKMIKDLISKLMQESTEETEHKGWCDTELTTNKQTRDAKTEAVNELTAQSEDLTSEIAQLTQDLEDLAKAVKELDAAMAEATADRTESKEKNEATIADAKAAQTAVENAMAVLKDFYAKAAQATALNQVQQSPAEDAPETFEKPYTGLLPEGGNVVDFLEVIMTDFVRLETETTTSEETEVDEYKKYMFESEKDKALKVNESKLKTGTKTDKESALKATEEELKLTQDQLDKAIEYYEKLKPTCVDSGITYEERVKRREEEIQSLQEALKILTGTDLS